FRNLRLASPWSASAQAFRSQHYSAIDGRSLLRLRGGAWPVLFSSPAGSSVHQLRSTNPNRWYFLRVNRSTPLFRASVRRPVMLGSSLHLGSPAANVAKVSRWIV